MQYQKHQRQAGKTSSGTMEYIMDAVLGFGVIIMVIAALPGFAANYLHRDIVHPIYYWDQAVTAGCGTDTQVVTYTKPASGSIPAFTYDSHNADQVTQCLMLKQGTLELSTQFWILIQQSQLFVVLAGAGVLILGILGIQQVKSVTKTTATST